MMTRRRRRINRTPEGVPRKIRHGGRPTPAREREQRAAPKPPAREPLVVHQLDVLTNYSTIGHVMRWFGLEASHA